MKRKSNPLLTGVLLFALSVSAAATEGNASDAPEIAMEEGRVPEVEAAVETPGGIHVIVNDAAITLDAPVQVWDEVSYVSYWPIVRALYPDAAAEWVNGRSVITAPGLRLEVWPGSTYFVANGRCLYLPDGVRSDGEMLLLPVRLLGRALGADVAWDPIGGHIVITAGTAPIASAEAAYPEDVLYWLSHIIHAEAGNQPLAGKIAVGNVVLNRVASSLFPNTVYEVIHQRGQFTPVANGSIRLQPNEESVLAAKLCLDGANTAGNALYFMNPRTSASSWMARHRSYVTTIAQHAFYA